MTLKQKTKENYKLLLRCVDPSNELLGNLWSVPFVQDRASAIKQKSTVDDKNDALLTSLLETPDDIQESVMNGVISALKDSGQDHVASIFREESDKVPMSDEHFHTLMVEKIDQLCEIIDPENGLINKLVRTKVISPVNAQAIRSMPGYNEKVRQLIEILSRKSDDAFNGFINALHLTGQSHVSYVLTGEGNSRPLKDEHRKRLLSSPRDHLVKTMESKNSGLVTALMDKGVFSIDDEQRVTSVQPDIDDNRNELILNLIARKSQSDFFKFISTLHDTNQTHVAVTLFGESVIAKITTVYESGADSNRIPDVDAELVEYMREVFRSNDNVVRRINEILLENGITVSDVGHGCIEITFTCESVESFRHFRELYNSEELEQMLNEAFCFRFANKGLKSLKLKVSNERIKQCADTFACWAPMTSKHREALMSSEEGLLDKMTISGDLLRRLSLCKRRRQAIEQAATREQQVKTLIDIVSRRPDSAFTQLLDALKETDQHEAAAIVSDDDPNLTVPVLPQHLR